MLLRALQTLRGVRAALKEADDPQALKRVQAAIKSTEGAYWHALRREAQHARARGELKP